MVPYFPENCRSTAGNCRCIEVYGTFTTNVNQCYCSWASNLTFTNIQPKPESKPKSQNQLRREQLKNLPHNRKSMRF